MSGRNTDGGKLTSRGMGVLVYDEFGIQSKKVERGAGAGRKMIVGVVYVNPEGVREMERLFEVLQVDMVKYGKKAFDVIVMGISMQELDWKQRNIQIVFGRGCWSW